MQKKIFKLGQVFLVSALSYYIVFFSSFNTFQEAQPFFGFLFGLQILTFIFVIGFYLLLLSLTNRNWLSTTLILLLAVIFGFVNHTKLTLRNEPFLPSDLGMITSLPELIHMITLKALLLIILAVIAITGLCLLVFRKQRLKFFNTRRSRWRTLAVALLLCGGFFSISNSKSPVHNLGLALNNDPLYWDPVWGVKRNGPILNFVNYLNSDIMTEPSHYSKKTMLALQKRYQKKAQTTNKTRQTLKNTDVVLILSESFSDPTKVPGITLNQDPMPYTRQLLAENPSGTMISNGYGGGTANMEFQALTGLSMGNFAPSLITPYTQLVSKLNTVHTFNNDFTQSIALHPYNGGLYNRHAVLKKFGFSKFYTQDGPDYFPYKDVVQNNPYVSDQATYQATLDQINANQSGSTFYHVLTMQNHMPYLKKYYPDNPFKVSGDLSTSEKSQIETYANGVNLTDQANRYFLTALQKVKKNVIVIFYGDHLPGIYSHVNFKKYGVQMHETPYFIWSNHATLTKAKAPSTLGPYSFESTLANVANTKVSGYTALLTQVTNQLPIITTNMLSSGDPNNVKTNTQLVTATTKKLVRSKDLTAKQKKLLQDYRLVQYDLTAGQHYLSTAFTKP
ncbi:LTA synthase family protein [Agrilactobacillus yilanensis]|uniref:LTA synthase family protein n=1 Tax=Agrilactobacillus yilanensis TaxID=2485997 RepID=A0ABW4J8T0_9LACO|nr:alkaline phosphatase family protein [Agrilactobacillus yilanensis]